jgi:hypothetical protein
MAATSAAFKCGSGTAPAYLALLFAHVGGYEELIRTVIGSNRIEALPIRLTDRPTETLPIATPSTPRSTGSWTWYPRLPARGWCPTASYGRVLAVREHHRRGSDGAAMSLAMSVWC